MGVHFRKVCRHGRVVAQCRCPGPKADQVVACLPSCEDECDPVVPAKAIIRGVEWFPRICDGCGKPVAARSPEGQVLCTSCHPGDLPFVPGEAG